MRTKMKVLFAILILGTAVLAGCRNQENTGGDAETETIKVTDAKGEVEIPKHPERIVDLTETAIFFLFLVIRLWARQTRMPMITQNFRLIWRKH